VKIFSRRKFVELAKKRAHSDTYSEYHFVRKKYGGWLNYAGKPESFRFHLGYIWKKMK
jgi:hypothetical protein